jgi:hypothetical protein
MFPDMLKRLYSITDRSDFQRVIDTAPVPPSDQNRSGRVSSGASSRSSESVVQNPIPRQASSSMAAIPMDRTPIQILRQDFGYLKFSREMGQEYVEREYWRFPLGQMVQANAVKYGSQVGINVIIIEFNGNRDEILSRIIASYSDAGFDAERLEPPEYPSMYKLSEANNRKNQVGLWWSGGHLVLVHGDNIFWDGSSQENIMEAYMQLYRAESL